MGHSNVHMMCECNSPPDGCIYDFGGEEAVGSLPHEQQALIQGGFEAELIWKVEIRIEYDHLVIFTAK
jgi:hypothetical protein